MTNLMTSRLICHFKSSQYTLLSFRVNEKIITLYNAEVVLDNF